MALGADIEAWLPELRRQAESLHVDQCRITRTGGARGPMDPETGQYPERPRVAIYEGPCRLQVTAADAAETGAGDMALRTQGTTLQLPVEATEDVAPGDVAEMLHSANDPAVVGRKYTVTTLHHKTHATSRRVRVTEGVGQ